MQGKLTLDEDEIQTSFSRIHNTIEKSLDHFVLADLLNRKCFVS